MHCKNSCFLIFNLDIALYLLNCIVKNKHDPAFIWQILDSTNSDQTVEASSPVKQIHKSVYSCHFASQ